MRYSDLGNGRFQNPILFADYSDPDVIRVGDAFYMTASSFNYTPGLPILISRDLVNWELVNYALENIPEERYGVPRHSEGVWAPAIRFHDGMFYIYYGMPDEGYYVVRSADPLGKWEEPVCILKGKGLIDPCPFWDDDGRAYVIHGYAKSRIGFKSILGIFEMSSDGMSAISEDHFIFDGNDPEHPAVTIEGPKVYKRNGYYYILAPAGGVREGYQVALRSRDIHGPYEIKTVMHQGNTVINGPHQGGLVDTLCGQEWFIHFQDRGLYGRICHLQPVTWREGWPVIGVNPDEDGCGEPVYEMDKPDTQKDGKDGENLLKQLEASDSFPGGIMGLQWQWLGNHRDAFYGKTGSGNGLRLYALNPSGDENVTLWRSANVLTQKLIYPVFSAEICVDAQGLKEGERAGVCMTGGQYTAAYIENDGGEYYVKVIESEGGDADKTDIVKNVLRLRDIFGKAKNGSEDDAPDLWLKDLHFLMDFNCSADVDSRELYFQNAKCQDKERCASLTMSISTGDGDKTSLDINYTPSDHTWVGAKIGIFALSCGNTAGADAGFADFKSVVVTEK